MIKTRKFLLVFLSAIALFFSCLAAFAMNANNVVYAATSYPYYTAEQYTNSDYLLFDNGTESLVRTIRSFSSDVKAASVDTSFPELAQVIPRQYLESAQQNAVFQYNGKEYGFYVVKEDNHFDVLLIDFVYEFEDSDEHSDIEYKIRIKPLL